MLISSNKTLPWNASLQSITVVLSYTAYYHHVYHYVITKLHFDISRHILPTIHFLLY